MAYKVLLLSLASYKNIILWYIFWKSSPLIQSWLFFRQFSPTSKPSWIFLFFLFNPPASRGWSLGSPTSPEESGNRDTRKDVLKGPRRGCLYGCGREDHWKGLLPGSCGVEWTCMGIESQWLRVWNNDENSISLWSFCSFFLLYIK